MQQIEINDISADSSLVDPEKDLLGHASFAKYLADSICKMTFPQGFVIAVYGSWNSGKSTLLNFVVHYLQQKPEAEQPIIVPFNPWLFSTHQNIARRFFEQLQNVLSQHNSVPKGLKDRLADIASLISEIPLPYTQTGKALAALLDEKDKDASELKAEVETTLVKQQRRIVVTIDDIDRLATEDIKQLFRIFKTMRDFTNVVYLLVFDQEVIKTKLTDNKDISQSEYLEKIIQASFELPVPNKTSLRKLLFSKLDTIFGEIPKQEINPNRWADIYFQSIDHFITDIRDIVRFINTLTVTYAAVKDEVNPIDFIAIESLRVFCPIIYGIIHQNRHIFLGEFKSAKEEIKNLLNTWIAQLQNQDKQPIKKLLIHLFPKLNTVWGNTYIDESEELQWHEQLRVCSADIFPRYFRLTLSANELSKAEIQSLLALATDVDKFTPHLLELTQQKLPDGTTKLRIFLEHLENYLEEEIPVNSIPVIVESLSVVSNQISLSQNDDSHGVLDFGDDVIIRSLIARLLHRLDEKSRSELLTNSNYSMSMMSINRSQADILHHS
jgi:predicted KAP-like P-loop ATPase